MIIDNNTNPERDLYYLGGKMIDVILRNGDNVDFLDLYKQFSQEQHITISLFSLVLDWLYILGLITNEKEGRITKCF